MSVEIAAYGTWICHYDVGFLLEFNHFAKDKGNL